MKILVTGGTGTVGSAVAASLLEKGAEVRALTRSAEKAAALPAGVDGYVGDFDKPETLRGAFEGADRVFLLNTVSPNETEQGLAGVDAAQAACVERLVYMSVHLPDGSYHIPHFASKIPVEEAVRTSGIGHTILRPNNFFQNDFWFQEAIPSYGVYAQLIGGAGVSRVDVQDIADAAVNALLELEHARQTYTVHGPDALTGEGTAALYSRLLGKPIAYGGDDLDAWAEQAGAMMPDWMVKDMVVMFRYFQVHGFAASQEELAHQRRVVGHDPRTFDGWVGKIVPAWAA